MKAPKSFIAYLITNTVNGKRYVGITSGVLARRWSQHICLSESRRAKGIGMAIAKYGVAAFTIEAFASALTWADLTALERLLILQENTKAPSGYNLTDGGEGVVNPSDETRQLIGNGRRGKVGVSAATAAKMRAAAIGRKGTPITAVARIRLDLSQGTDEARANKSAGMKASEKAQANVLRLHEAAKGSQRSAEARARMSIAQKARFARSPQASPSPELLARLIDSANRPEVLAKKSAASRRRWAS